MFWFTVIISVIIFYAYRFTKYQRSLYIWHCENIYPFDKALTLTEKTYVQSCIDFSSTELLRIILFNKFLNRLSFYSYSHQIKNNKINSGRFAYGLAVFPKIAQTLAQPVLIERNITIPLNNNNVTLSGLGWDFNNKTFRIYSQFINFDILPNTYKKLSTEGDFFKSGIVSWTYDENNTLVETKIYRYSIKKPENNRNLTLLSSDKRPLVKQFDCDNEYWYYKINNNGQKIIDFYKKNNIKLDTINFKDKNNYTLYFPRI